MKEERFEKVVEYGESFIYFFAYMWLTLFMWFVAVFNNSPVSGFVAGAFFMITNFLIWDYVKARKVYWRKIK